MENNVCLECYVDINCRKEDEFEETTTAYSWWSSHDTLLYMCLSMGTTPEGRWKKRVQRQKTKKWKTKGKRAESRRRWQRVIEIRLSPCRVNNNYLVRAYSCVYLSSNRLLSESRLRRIILISPFPRNDDTAQVCPPCLTRNHFNHFCRTYYIIMINNN